MEPDKAGLTAATAAHERGLQRAAFAPSRRDEIHIVGLIVHARHARINSIAQTINTMDGAEIHAMSEQGKLVVTIEANGSGEIVHAIETMQTLPGVYSVSLVYQHHEDAESLNEELANEADTPRVHQANGRG